MRQLMCDAATDVRLWQLVCDAAACGRRGGWYAFVETGVRNGNWRVVRQQLSVAAIGEEIGRASVDWRYSIPLSKK